MVGSDGMPKPCSAATTASAVQTESGVDLGARKGARRDGDDDDDDDDMSVFSSANRGKGNLDTMRRA